MIYHPEEDLDQFAKLANQAVEIIGDLNGFGPAVATCILALARPDLLVPVNGSSAEGLGNFAHLPATPARLAGSYYKLLISEPLAQLSRFRRPWPASGVRRGA